jgi:hypothetical protein
MSKKWSQKNKNGIINSGIVPASILKDGSEVVIPCAFGPLRLGVRKVTLVNGLERPRPQRQRSLVERDLTQRRQDAKAQRGGIAILRRLPRPFI